MLQNDIDTSKSNPQVFKIVRLTPLIFLAGVAVAISFAMLPSISKARNTAHDSVEVCIQGEKQSLSQALTAIAEQLDIEISTLGSHPKSVRDYHFNNMPVERCVDRLMKLYGISNHAAIYDFDNNKLLLTMFEPVSSNKKISRINSPLSTITNSDGRLNEIQIAQLNDDNSQSDSEILSVEQRNKLKELEQDQGNQKLLSPSQIHQLQEQRKNEISMDFNGEDQQLTSTQKAMLQKIEAKTKSSKNSSLLSSEQLLKLKEASPQNAINVQSE